MKKNSPLVSIIIINWNGLHFLKPCLETLYKQSYKNIEVIVVDNASHDGSVQFVEKQYPKVKIVVNKENLGFAEANNIGYKKVTGEYVLFLNNDTKVTKDFLSILVTILQKDTKKQLGGVQSKLLLMDTPEKLDSVGAFLTPTGFLYHYGIAKKDGNKYNKRIDVYSAKGACMMLRREVIEQVLVDGEIFDSTYFAYFEETDMCHRVWLAGYRLVFVPESIIYHKMGGTSTKMNNAFVQFHSFKNRINSYIKNFGTSFLFTILPLHILFCEAFALFALLKGNYNISVCIQKAIWWNLKNMNQTLRKRKYIQHTIRIKKDSQIKRYIMRPVRLSYYYYILFDLGRYED